MRIDDVYVIIPYDHNKAITDKDILEYSNYTSKVSLSSLCKGNFSNRYIFKTLGKYIIGHNNTFTCKEDYRNIIFKELYSKLKKECKRLIFKDFRNPFFLSNLSTVLPDSPIIADCNSETGITVGILEDFLRMPDIKIEETTFKVVSSYFLRHM